MSQIEAMKILVLDASEASSNALKLRIRSDVPDAELTIINSEKNFRRHLEGIGDDSWPYKVVVLNPFAPWTTNEDDLDREALELNALAAGNRCHDLLRQKAISKEVPIIFWSILDRTTVPVDAYRVDRRSDNFGVEALTAEIKKAVSFRPAEKASAVFGKAEPFVR